ncbi:hypothetical protein Kpol_530p30 [Vanderwaltozyma polyspora DSM 70294]|uniref:Ubiquinone biosynthesis protein n=1 Tax=Vanderwaltozyma polyspora (strain ATCC 22028 / DSM 70294 / BCRC 21397 / CBS 2163 / NBRC 10782 / NRRL Y-8283 / UCD 57-17) TaxID=436907 RepID=A7TL04_VANPO|nr:uncharacterized protein Kpol_530p30 [Vanderwaltozyma polyspora DSM 70294]EDO17060.1 hypothetical protein Kpol_530p30 [Vanderwaltozyma polyspora DSM 70294]
MLKNFVPKRTAFGLTRFYHPNPKEYVPQLTLPPLLYGKDSKQYKILSHSLDVSVPEFGFNERAIVNSINLLGYPSSILSVIGSSNTPSFLHSSTALMELLKFNLVAKRYQLSEDIPLDTPVEELPSLEDLLIKRLKMDVPIGPHLSQLIAQLSIPGPFLTDTSLPELHRLADDMIYFSSEKDHPDFAWYAKRMGVSTAYMSSKLFMAQDRSPGYVDTFEFAKDKLKRIMKLGDYYNNAEEYAWYVLMNSINMAKSKAARG